MLHAVILAGGAGTRLWPESRRRRPKQFLTVHGDRSMLQATADRLLNLVPPARTLVVTTEDLSEKIQEQLPQLPPGSVLREPCPRNTAPAIALAAIHVVRRDPEGIMAVMPADHVISPSEVFQQAISLAAELVAESPRLLVTFGVPPTYPATTFGYIQRGEAIASERILEKSQVYRVEQFHEKPNTPTARDYLQAGTFYWNSGIFLWRAQAILDAIARYQPRMFVHLRRLADAIGTPEWNETLAQEFSVIEKVSIDCAVMERADEVVVVEAPFQWDDVGSWLSVQRHHRPDERGNLVDAARHIEIETSGAIVRAGDPDHLVVLAGVTDLIVVVTPDATLVANKNDDRSIARITEEIKRRGWDQYL